LNAVVSKIKRHRVKGLAGYCMDGFGGIDGFGGMMVLAVWIVFYLARGRQEGSLTGWRETNWQLQESLTILLVTATMG
jgi:hypothetical protein